MKSREKRSKAKKLHQRKCCWQLLVKWIELSLNPGLLLDFPVQRTNKFPCLLKSIRLWFLPLIIERLLTNTRAFLLLGKINLSKQERLHTQKFSEWNLFSNSNKPPFTDIQWNPPKYRIVIHHSSLMGTGKMWRVPKIRGKIKKDSTGSPNVLLEGNSKGWVF